MFEKHILKIESEKKNLLINKNINLNLNMDCFISISSDNNSIWDLILNNILENIIDKISKENTYNDFSLALDNINSFLKTWKKDIVEDIELDVIISILNENNYIFSNIWKTFCCFIDSNNEIIELTEKNECKKEFSFIFNWDIQKDDIIISSNKRILDYLSRSDILDWLNVSNDFIIFNKNIENILKNELIKENILINSIKYIDINIDNNNLINKSFYKEYLIKIFDNKISKNIIWYFLLLKDKINGGKKNIKNIFFISWIIICIIFLYYIISVLVSVSTQNDQKDLAKENILKTKVFLKIASENISNSEIFKLNIDNAKDILSKVSKKEIFLNDIEKINNDINILKKQFYKIETFEEKKINSIYKSKIKNHVKILKNNWKLYIVWERSIISDIIPNKKSKTFIFSSLNKNEKFIDAIFVWINMYILTDKSKIIKFTKKMIF